MANELQPVVIEVLSKTPFAMSVSGATTAGGAYAYIESISSILGLLALAVGVVLTTMLAIRAYWDIRLKRKQVEKFEKEKLGEN